MCVDVGLLFDQADMKLLTWVVNILYSTTESPRWRRMCSIITDHMPIIHQSLYSASFAVAAARIDAVRCTTAALLDIVVPHEQFIIISVV